MASVPVTVAKLDGLFKEVYGSDVKNLIPETAKIVRKVKFSSSDKELGLTYNQPVILTQEHGMTYAGPNSGAFTLLDHVAMTTKNAQVDGYQMLLRSAIDYEAAAKASNNKKAFLKSTELVVENMLESITKRLEISCIYGQQGIATGATVNIDGTHTTYTVSLATWAVGIWTGLENARLNFYDSGVLVSSSNDAIFTVDSVDLDAREVVISGTATGIIALDAAVAPVAWFEGSNGNEMAGIDKIITNTGTLFGIDAGTYNLWKGNVVSAGSAALTISKVINALHSPIGRGLDEPVDMYCNPKTWANLNTELVGNRRYDGSYSKMKGDNGFQDIEYYSQNGKITIISHNCVKEGDAFLIPNNKCRRVGAQDVSFNTPGRGDEIFRQLEDKAGFEMRVYTDQAFFIECPARCLKINNIVNT